MRSERHQILRDPVTDGTPAVLTGNRSARGRDLSLPQGSVAEQSTDLMRKILWLVGDAQVRVRHQRNALHPPR